MTIAAGSPVGFVTGGAYENYTGEFVREVEGKALVVVNSPEEMVVLVGYEHLVTEQPEDPTR